MSEIVWFETKLKPPQNKPYDVEYLVTVYCKHWKPTTKTITMEWGKTVIKGKEQYGWKWNGNSCVSTWEVTDWAYMPEPAWKEEE